MDKSAQINSNVYVDMNDILLFSITEYLFKLGFQANLRGFSYAKEAILLRIKDHVISCSLTDIYDKIALKHNVKSISIERAIRYAIENAWNKESLEWNKYLPRSAYCPANAEFIAESAELIMLGLKFKDKSEIF